MTFAVRPFLRDVLVLFAWGFVMHTTGLLLHEFGGHGLAGTFFGCGIDGYRLTFFGHGQVHYAPCTRWTETTTLIADWAGLALTIGAGLVAAGVSRRRSLSPEVRLLAALVAFTFLIGQLGYATSGGFHDLYDPRHLARRLGARGLHVIAWLPALLAYAVSAFFCARAVVDASREVLGARSRRQSLLHFATRFGVAGALYYAAFWIEWRLRTDMTMRGVTAEAERVAVVRNAAHPFPISLVLAAIVALALIAALARPVRSRVEAEEGATILPSRRVLLTVSTSAATCLVVLLVLILR